MDRLRVLYNHISPQVVFEDSLGSISIKLNRPKALNAFNYEILASLTNLVLANPGRTMVFSSTLPKSFCAGGDVVASVQNNLSVPEFYRNELTTFYYISLEKQTVALVQGFSIGAGNGLVMACKYRVVTSSTKFSMPENSIGLVPDTGASFFLSHLPNKAIGMFLMLTGNSLNGNDCYWAGIATHYVPEEKIPELHAELMKTGDILNSIDKFACVPDKNESDLLKNLPEIEMTFSNVISIDLVLQRLSESKKEWSKGILKTINGLCPLSLKVAVASFNYGLKKTYEQCLQQDYNIEIQMCFIRSFNYTTAITQKFIKKEKGEIRWYPETIDQVTDEMVNTIIENPEGPKLVFPSF